MSSSPAGRAPRPPRHQQPRQTRLHGSGTATPEGSATQTITSLNPSRGPDGLVLRLRGSPSPQPAATAEEESQQPNTQRRRTIQWAEDVIDNEGLGRKKSKVCCIFHKSREVGESSSEDDSSSSDSDQSDSSSGGGGGDDGSARPVGGRKRGRRRGRRHGHEHKDGEDCGHGHGEGGHRKPSPNAYERMPRYDVKPLERQPGS